MKRTYTRSLIPLLLMLAMLTGLAILPTNSLAEDPLKVSMALDKGSVIQAGESVKVTLTPLNGRPPYTYRHMISIYEHGEEHFQSLEDGPDSTATWVIAFGESARLKSIAWDADGRSGSAETTLSIRGGVYKPLVITNETLSPGNSINIGDTITYSVYAEGGQPPYSYFYKLGFSQGSSWVLPVDDGPYPSNSLSYTVTRGSEGIIFSGVRDAVGRRVSTTTAVKFTIHGDSSRMIFTATHGMEKIDDNTHRMSIKANLEGGSPPAKYFCRWLEQKDGQIVNKTGSNNADGAFVLDTGADRVTAILHARDSEGWECGEELTIEFDARNKVPIRLDLLEWNPLHISLKEEIQRRWLYDQLIPFPQIKDLRPAPSTIERVPALPKLNPPKVTVPKITPPKIAPPKVTVPEIVNPQLPPPNISAPEVPVIRPPGL